MERTGVYWKPAYHVLSDAVKVWGANSHDVQQRPGQKTDKRDATWVAELLAHGLIKPSFVPPPEIRALRDLTRTRVSLVQTRTQDGPWNVHRLREPRLSLPKTRKCGQLSRQ